MKYKIGQIFKPKVEGSYLMIISIIDSNYKVLLFSKFDSIEFDYVLTAKLIGYSYILVDEIEIE